MQEKPAAVISLDVMEHNFGNVSAGETVYYSFVLRNSGNDMLILSNVKKSCGCTTPEFSREPVMPGGETKIKIGFNSSTPGPFTKAVTVFSNAKNSPLVLKIKGTVVTE